VESFDTLLTGMP